MEPFIGQIQPFGFNFAPRGWAHCDGQLIAISSNSALFSLLGTIYGGDGRTTFALPDLRGRAPIHMGSGAGLTPRSIGQKSGLENVTLTTPQIPSHSHSANGTIKCSTNAGDEDSPQNHYSAAHAGDENYSSSTNENMASQGVSVTVGSAGGGLAHTNMQPYLVINWCIALIGIFPSRN
ncbi:MAG: phage tail protein [Roseibacillus sp.]